MRTPILVAAALVLVVRPVQAGVLAPSKPSSIVTLVSGSSCDIGSHKMDTRILPDGTAEPFVIPPKQVLVLTGTEWTFAVGAAEGGLIDILLIPAPPAVGNSVFSAGALAPANGIGRGSAPIPDVVVGPGVDICADVPFGTSAVTLHGFLAKDK